MKKFISTTLMIAVFTALAFSKNLSESARVKDNVPDSRFNVIIGQLIAKSHKVLKIKKAIGIITSSLNPIYISGSIFNTCR